MIAPTLWIEITIAGFVYLIGIFFFLLAGYGIADPRTLLPNEHFLPYLSAGVVAASYAIGVVAHRIVQQIRLKAKIKWEAAISALKRKSTPAEEDDKEWYNNSLKIWHLGSERINREIDFQYALVALLRSLVCSIPFVGLSAIVWLARTGQTGTRSVVVMVVTFWVPSFAAYYWQQSNFDDLRREAAAEARIWATLKARD
jgi:hypothetical protein